MKNKILYLIPIFLLLIFLVLFTTIFDFMIMMKKLEIQHIQETTGKIIVLDRHTSGSDMRYLSLVVILLSIISKLILKTYLKKQGISINKWFKIITNIVYIFIILTLLFFTLMV